MLSQLLAESNVFECLPAVEREVLLARFSWALFSALDVAPGRRPASRPYSLLRTASKASPRWRMTWNLSNKIAAFGAYPSPQGECAHSLRRARHRTRSCSAPAVLAAKPDRPAAQEIAHHDPISVALADRNLVNADHLRTRPARSRKLGLHVLLVEGLGRYSADPATKSAAT